MKRLTQSLILGTLLLFGLVGCREDTSEPVFVLSHPPEDTIIAATEYFFIRGEATDPEGLSQVRMILREESTDKTVTSLVFDLEGKSDRFSESIPAGNLHSESGYYILRVEVSDINQNESWKERRIWIDEVPTELLGIAFAQKGSGNMRFGYWRDGGLLTSELSLEASDVIADIDNYHQNLLLGDETGRFRIVNPEDPSDIRSSELFAPGFLETGIHALWSEPARYYVGFGSAPYQVARNKSGDALFTLSEAAGPVQACWANENILIVAYRSAVSGSASIESFSITTRNRLDSYNPGFPVERIEGFENGRIIIAGTDTAVTRIMVLDPGSLIPIRDFAIAGYLKDLATASNTAHVLTSEGWRKINGESLSMSGVLVAGSYSCLSWEEENGELLLGGLGEIHRYGAGGSPLGSFSVGSDSVKWIRPHLNK